MIGRELVFSTWYGRCREVAGKFAFLAQGWVVYELVWKRQNDNSTWCSQAVSHPSTNQAQRCLTSVIRRELVFSTWYGRCREVAGKFAFLAQGWVVYELVWKRQNDNSTWCSQAVSHPSTNQAQRCLTSVIRRELVFSTWYGRCQDIVWKLAFLNHGWVLYEL